MNSSPQNSVLGSGRGLDHIAIATNDLDAATNHYHQTLGFAAAQRTRLPNGVDTSIIWFADSTYLELLTFYDRELAGFLAAIVGDKLGGIFYALDISSAEETITYLREKGFQVTDPIGGTTAVEGMTEAPPELWRYVMFLQPITAANEFFLIEYHWETLAALSEKYPGFSPAKTAVHANTAKSLKSVWVAVHDLDAAIQAYTSIGLEALQKVAVPKINAVGVAIEAADSVILLLEPDDPIGATATFLEQRGPGLIGMSIEVANLQTAEQLIKANTMRHFESYWGTFGESILIPAELANGIWLELFQA
jgi:catechol 2,3-dioxygenase-like lactoylglutathione lyase family enzyme